MDIIRGSHSAYTPVFEWVIAVAMVTLGVVLLHQSTTSMPFAFLTASISLPSFLGFANLDEHWLSDLGPPWGLWSAHSHL